MTKRKFSVAAVVAAYNVGRYLDDFLSSLERQTLALEKIQLVFVDDGSTDHTLETLQTWARGRESHVTVIPQENAWVAAARNTGIEHVDADWVTFADPDDVFEASYFEEVVKFIETHGEKGVGLLETHQLRVTDDGVVTDTHPLRGKFAKRSRIIDLEVEPIIQLSVNTAFFDVDRLLQAGTKFDGRVRPVFEDAHFVARYLLDTGTHTVGLVASARYLYRTRSDGTSLMQTHFDQEGKYTDVLRYGHLDLVERATALGGLPRWLENTLLYDLFWYFKNELALQSLSALAPAHVFPEFHELVGLISRHLSADAITTFDIMGVEQSVRIALLRGYGSGPFRPEHVTLLQVDEAFQTVQLAYWFSGEVPAETFCADGHDVEPVHETAQNYVFYGHTVVRRRIVWLDRAQTTTVTVDGSTLPVVPDDPLGAPLTLTARQLNPTIMSQRRHSGEKFDHPDQPLLDHLRGRFGRWRLDRREARTPERRLERHLDRTIHSSSARKKFSHAWVFMDRNTDANDNAEHLYRYVAATHPEVNSWFVLERQSGDWARLEAEGFRLVAYKSNEWYELLLHADHLASSHIDQYVVAPLEKDIYGPNRFHYTFLQHGVTNYDISRWVNSKPINLFVVVTPAEHAAIAGPGPYSFSDREVKATGFPRHDALLSKRAAVAEANRDLIVVMPTWRKKLAGRQVIGSNERLKNPDFMTSEFATRYLELLHSERLRDLARRTGKKLTFMPHPNIRPYLADFDLPDDVNVLDFAVDNVQDVLAHAAALVTDYSSLAFDAAYIDVPLVYFQFDAAGFFDGTHVGRRGYFDYDRDGFGPVAETVEDVEKSLDAIAQNRFASQAAYRDRTTVAFPVRDGQNSERTFRAMQSLDPKRGASTR